MALNTDAFGVLNGVPPKIVREPVTARVTKIDQAGIWVVPIDGDMRTPIGPCRGPFDIALGSTCLVVWTQERPWVLSAELLTELNVVTLLEQAATDAQDKSDAARDEAIRASTPAAHADDDNNPHHVSKEQVGLGSVDNTSDYDKPISAATQEVLDGLTALAVGTGPRRVVEDGAVSGLPGLAVVLQRQGALVTVTVRGSSSATTGGAMVLFTLPSGFQPAVPAAIAGVCDSDGIAIDGSGLAVSGSQVVLHAVTGSQHFSALTYPTNDTMPTVLPGIED